MLSFDNISMKYIYLILFYYGQSNSNRHIMWKMICLPVNINFGSWIFLVPKKYFFFFHFIICFAAYFTSFKSRIRGSLRSAWDLNIKKNQRNGSDQRDGPSGAEMFVLKRNEQNTGEERGRTSLNFFFFFFF